MKCISLAFILVVLITGVAQSAPLVHGQIVAVYPDERSLLVLSGDDYQLLQLADGAEIWRDGQLVQLNSARPITKKDFQEGILWLDREGLVARMEIHYQVEEQLAETGNGHMLSLLRYVDIFGAAREIKHVSIVEGNSPTSSEL